jgi:hypothetical protein
MIVLFKLYNPPFDDCENVSVQDPDADKAEEEASVQNPEPWPKRRTRLAAQLTGHEWARWAL